MFESGEKEYDDKTLARTDEYSLSLEAKTYILKIDGYGDWHDRKGMYSLSVGAVKPSFLLGDVDFSGDVTSADARLTLRRSVGLEEFTELQMLAGDVDFNKEITSADARLILRCSVGLEKF